MLVGKPVRAAQHGSRGAGLAEPRGRRMSVCAGVWAPLWSTATVGDRHRDYGAAMLKAVRAIESGGVQG